LSTSVVIGLGMLSGPLMAVAQEETKDDDKEREEKKEEA
jgi:hypothetical protein